MKQRRAFTRTSIGFASLATLVGSWSCSLLYDLSTKQCDTTDDCLHQGPQFAHSVCQDHVCVQTNASNTGGNSSIGGTSGGDLGGSSELGGVTSMGGSFGGGSTSTGGARPGGTSAAGGNGTATGGQTNAGGVGGAGGVIQVGGTPAAAGDTSLGGAQPTGGTGATGGATGPECTTNSDCIIKHNQPYICKSGACVSLTSDNCQVLIPNSSSSNYNYLNLLQNSTPVIVGGFASQGDPANAHNTEAIVNWDLAFDDFNTKTLGGLPSFRSGGPLRPFVGVICQGKDNIANPAQRRRPSMTHLTRELGVTSMLSTLSPLIFDAHGIRQQTKRTSSS